MAVLTNVLPNVSVCFFLYSLYIFKKKICFLFRWNLASGDELMAA